MCIVFFKYRMDPNFPILLGANREENIKRPAFMPGGTMNGITYAGVDRGSDGKSEQVGTWLGINRKNNLLIAVTNRDDGVSDGIQSRGVLCNYLLQSPNVAHALKELNDALGLTYSGANYIILSPEIGYVVQVPNRDNITTLRVHQGVHAITNLDLNDPNDKRIAFVKENLVGGNADHFVDAAQFLCCHEKIVINDPLWGTVSSAIVGMSEANFDMKVSSILPRSSLDFSYVAPRG